MKPVSHAVAARTRVRLLALLLGLWSALAGANMLTSRHNLASRFLPGTGSAAAEQEVCIFCHTPQGVPRGLDLPPTWSPSHAGATEFRVFDPLEAGPWPGAQSLPGTVIGFQSFVCLSCHDGTQAEVAGGRASLDHPVGVPYRGASEAAPLLRSSAERGPPDDLVSEYRGTSAATVGGTQVWWVSTTGRSTRSKNDLPLYARADPYSGTAVPFIECATCHDPHSGNERFLRVAQTSSGLCMSCHNK